MPSPDRIFRALACSFTLLAVVACGGGGGGGSAPPATSTASQPPASPPPSVSTPTESTRLSDNVVPPGASFDNFRDAQVRVPVSRAGLSSTKVFVKVSRADGELLFIGPAAPERDFAVPVQVPAGETVLFYEIFSDSREDQIVFGEIRL